MSLAGNDQQVEEEEETPPLKASEAFGGQILAVDLRNSEASEAETMALQAGGMGDDRGLSINSIPHLLTSSSAASPAKTSPSPASAEASPESDPASSSSSPASPMSLFGPEDGFWSRTSRDSSPVVPARDVQTAGSFYDSIAEAGISLAAMPDEIIAAHIASLALLTAATWMAATETLQAVQTAARVAVATSPGASSPPTTARSSQWSAASSATSGFTTSPGECWIAVTSECPSEGAVSSSLPDVLEAQPHARFSLSPKAAAGILRRAQKRRRDLPRALLEALTVLASAIRGDGKRTT